VTEDWAAVAAAINQRSAELGLRQVDLIERSRVSKAVIGEITRNAVQRRRSARTLESLSMALEWHPQHLLAVLQGRRPPAVGEPVYRLDDDDIPAQLADIQHQLREITERLDELRGINDRLDKLNASLTAIDSRSADGRRGNR
jgi:hypothetical protein